jgi:hypothetical protein
LGRYGPAGFASSGNCLSEIAVGGPDSQQRLDQKIYRNRAVARFHFGDSRLAGTDCFCQVDLTPPFFLANISEVAAQGYFEVQVCGLFLASAENGGVFT